MTRTAASASPPLPPAPDATARARTRDDRLRPWIAFLQAHSALSHRLEVELRAAGHVSLAEYDALVQLAAAEHRRLRMNELADQVLLSRSGVSRLVDRLERQGWVERATCPTDARGSWATLTDAGLDTLRAAAPVHLAGVERHFLAPMDEADREGLARALDAVLAGLGSRSGASGPAAGEREAASSIPMSSPADAPSGG